MSISTRLILGIETSCDDTAVALVDSAGKVAASAVASQVLIHNRYGGVYPEMASRAHVDKIIPVVRMVLEDSEVAPADLAAIGVTRGPGLIGSLMVGLNTACGLGQGWRIPVFGINHLRGHLRSADLEESRVEYPATVLLVSGGHTILAHMMTKSKIKMIGTTRDDSVGEVYDKVARMLGLGYPGGPIVDKLAQHGEITVEFPRPLLRQGLEFSFSGLKSAVDRFIAEDSKTSPQDIAASFVAACMDVLISKCRDALEVFPSKSLVVVGGVAASPQLREGTRSLCDARGVKLCLPPLKWSTDNGAMIALASWDYLEQGIPANVEPQAGLGIEDY
jgi:N6-L-threonylcarbamoyladenine synthase